VFEQYVLELLLPWLGQLREANADHPDAVGLALPDNLSLKADGMLDDEPDFLPILQRCANLAWRPRATDR